MGQGLQLEVSSSLVLTIQVPYDLASLAGRIKVSYWLVTQSCLALSRLHEIP